MCVSASGVPIYSFKIPGHNNLAQNRNRKQLKQLTERNTFDALFYVLHSHLFPAQLLRYFTSAVVWTSRTTSFIPSSPRNGSLLMSIMGFSIQTVPRFASSFANSCSRTFGLSTLEGNVSCAVGTHDIEPSIYTVFFWGDRDVFLAL